MHKFFNSCSDCNELVLMTINQIRCDKCRKIVEDKRRKEYLQKLKMQVKTITCLDCNKTIVVKTRITKRCPECAKIIIKERARAKQSQKNAVKRILGVSKFICIDCNNEFILKGHAQKRCKECGILACHKRDAVHSAKLAMTRKAKKSCCDCGEMYIPTRKFQIRCCNCRIIRNRLLSRNKIMFKNSSNILNKIDNISNFINKNETKTTKLNIKLDCHENGRLKIKNNEINFKKYMKPAKKMWKDGKTIKYIAYTYSLSFSKLYFLIEKCRERYDWFPTRFKLPRSECSASLSKSDTGNFQADNLSIRNN